MTAVALMLLIVTMGCKKDVPVTGVALNEDNITVSVGAMATLTATVLPNDATNQAVSWASSDDAIATVVDGKVTANAVGTTTITVTTDEGKHTAICTVTVTPTEPEGQEEVGACLLWKSY